MPIGGFAGNGNKVEKEIIELTRALLEIEDIQLNYGDDPDAPKPFTVEGKSGKPGYESKPYINALVKVIDDYETGDNDGKKFWDKLFLTLNKDTGKWAASQNSKLGRLFKAHPKYGPHCFENPATVYTETDLANFQFEAGTEQREDLNGKKLEGTRIAWETIGPVPNRHKKMQVRNK